VAATHPTPDGLDQRLQSTGGAHTPGPWRLSAGDETAVYATGHSNIARTYCGGLTGIRLKTAEANARLIAAAPELLAQLQWAETVLKCWIEGSAQLDSIRATIAKAEGR
jgi:hypothetical protein